MTGQYRINDFIIPCPSEGRWQERRPIDVQGDMRPIYAPVRAYELTWELQTHQDWQVLVAAFEQLQSTGTAVVYLPAYPTTTGAAFGFQEYSGCLLGEPTVGGFFNQEYPSDVSLVIANIRVP